MEVTHVQMQRIQPMPVLWTAFQGPRGLGQPYSVIDGEGHGRIIVNESRSTCRRRSGIEPSSYDVIANVIKRITPVVQHFRAQLGVLTRLGLELPRYFKESFYIVRVFFGSTTLFSPN